MNKAITKNNTIARVAITLLLVAGLLFSSTTAVLGATDNSDTPAWNSSGSGVALHWTMSPTVYYGDICLSTSYKTQIGQAINNINATLETAGNITLHKNTDQLVGYAANSPYIIVHSENYGSTGWAGYTSWANESNGKLKNCQIKLNTKILKEDGISGNNGTQAVAAHELCHAIGLWHTSTAAKNKASIMYPNDKNYLDNGTYLLNPKVKSAIVDHY